MIQEKQCPNHTYFWLTTFSNSQFKTSIFQIKRYENVKCQFCVIPHHLMGLKMKNRPSHTYTRKHFQHIFEFEPYRSNVFSKLLNHSNHRISFVSFSHLFMSSFIRNLNSKSAFGMCSIVVFFSRTFLYEI